MIDLTYDETSMSKLILRLALLSLPAFAAGACAYPSPQSAEAPSPARPPVTAQGAYLAVGTEPFWTLEITPSHMTFNEMNGRNVRTPTPRVIHGFAGEIYNGRDLSVNIVHADCSDGMSDRVYPDRVQVTAKGRQYEGCGGEPITLQERAWRIRSIDGGTVPGNADVATVRFDGSRLSATVGCNRMSAPYTLQRGRLVAGAVASTRMGCPDALARLESRFGAIMAEPLAVRGTSSGGYTLQNGIGRIELSRAE